MRVYAGMDRSSGLLRFSGLLCSTVRRTFHGGTDGHGERSSVRKSEVAVETGRILDTGVILRGRSSTFDCVGMRLTKKCIDHYRVR